MNANRHGYPAIWGIYNGKQVPHGSRGLTPLSNASQRLLISLNDLVRKHI